jgi:hypothetical protein
VPSRTADIISKQTPRVKYAGPLLSGFDYAWEETLDELNTVVSVGNSVVVTKDRTLP